MTTPSRPATPELAQALVLAAITEVAPDLDAAGIAPDARLQEDLELDSMDFLNLVVALSEETGVEIPEVDYGRLATVRQCAEYLAGQGTGS